MLHACPLDAFWVLPPRLGTISFVIVWCLRTIHAFQGGSRRPLLEVARRELKNPIHRHLLAQGKPFPSASFSPEEIGGPGCQCPRPGRANNVGEGQKKNHASCKSFGNAIRHQFADSGRQPPPVHPSHVEILRGMQQDTCLQARALPWTPPPICPPRVREGKGSAARRVPSGTRLAMGATARSRLPSKPNAKNA